jgi:hypothetical protein
LSWFLFSWSFLDNPIFCSISLSDDIVGDMANGDLLLCSTCEPVMYLDEEGTPSSIHEQNLKTEPDGT